MQKFRPLVGFFSPETQSEYIEGLLYTIRTTTLDKLARRWLEEGKIVFVDSSRASLLAGMGSVEKPKKRFRRLRKFFSHS